MANYTVPDWAALGEEPTIPPPPGVQSNFVNPVSLQKFDVLTQAVCLTVATTLVLMRLYTKALVLKNLWWDDFTSALAWVLLVANGIICLEEDRYGNGRHLWDVKGNDFTMYLKFIWASNILYPFVIFLAKLSILLLYLRVFKPNKRARLGLQVVLYANLLFYTTGIFLEAFQCRPIIKVWLPLVPGRCLDQQKLQLASAVFNLISDIVILCLPIASVWSLKLTKRGKYGLMTIFAFGLLACVASLVRTVIIITKGHPHDGTWDWYSLNLWSAGEITSAIVAGCLPAMPAFLRHISGFQITIMISRKGSSSFGRRGQSLTVGSRVVEIGLDDTDPVDRERAWRKLKGEGDIEVRQV